jgi:hypothetical protein
MAYWSGVAFGFGVALFFIGLGVIPSGEDTLPWLKWGSVLIALCKCVGAYVYNKRARVESKVTPRSAG